MSGSPSAVAERLRRVALPEDSSGDVRRPPNEGAINPIDVGGGEEEDDEEMSPEQIEQLMIKVCTTPLLPAVSPTDYRTPLRISARPATMRSTNRRRAVPQLRKRSRSVKISLFLRLPALRPLPLPPPTGHPASNSHRQPLSRSPSASRSHSALSSESWTLAEPNFPPYRSLRPRTESTTAWRPRAGGSSFGWFLPRGWSRADDRATRGSRLWKTRKPNSTTCVKLRFPLFLRTSAQGRFASVNPDGSAFA